MLLSIPVSAVSVEVSEQGYYQEVGQIDLENIKNDLKVENSNLIVEDRTAASHSLIQEISKGDVLEELLIDGIEEGYTPIAIGYTTVYLKEVTDADGTHVEPMTLGEVQTMKFADTLNDGAFKLMVDGPKATLNRLTIYTGVFWQAQINIALILLLSDLQV